jgi:hypothetical protein
LRVETGVVTIFLDSRTELEILARVILMTHFFFDELMCIYILTMAGCCSLLGAKIWSIPGVAVVKVEIWAAIL